MTLATRVRRARYDGGTCPLCGRAIRTGQQIGMVDGSWCHTRCVLFGPDPDDQDAA